MAVYQYSSKPICGLWRPKTKEEEEEEEEEGRTKIERQTHSLLAFWQATQPCCPDRLHNGTWRGKEGAVSQQKVSVERVIHSLLSEVLQELLRSGLNGEQRGGEFHIIQWTKG